MQNPVEAIEREYSAITEKLDKTFGQIGSHQSNLKDDIQNFASGLAAARDLAESMGLNIPKEVNDALDAAGTANKVIGQLATGNYIGAALNVLGKGGLFGGSKQDPGAERHKQVMKRLAIIQETVVNGFKKRREGSAGNLNKE